MKKLEGKEFYILLIASVIVFSANIWGISVYIFDEAKNATCAREMLDRNDFIVPTFNHQLRTDKRPLHYYFIQLSYSVFGVNEFAARFFSALMGILTVMVTWFFTGKILGRKVGFYAGLTMLFSFQFAIQFHLATPDPFLIFFITLSLFSFYYAHLNKSKRYLLLFYVALAFAVLSKGPVAIVLPGFILLLYLFFQKELNFTILKWALNLPSILVFLMLVLPWFILVHIKTEGAFTEGFFLKHNVNRFTSTMEGHGGGLLIIPLFLITGLLPYSVFIFQAMLKGWKNRHHSFIQLAMLVVVVFVVFFSISKTKLPSYPAPCFPFAAILIGYYLKDLVTTKLSLSDKIGLIIYSILGLSFPFAIYLVALFDTSLVTIKYVAWYFALLPLSAVLIWFKYKKTLSIVYTMGGAFYITSLMFFYFVFPAVDAQNPINEGIGRIKVAPSVIAYQHYNPSFSFYYKKPIKKIYSIEAMDAYLKSNENALILTNTRNESSLDSLRKYKLVYNKKDLFESRNTRIFSKK